MDLNLDGYLKLLRCSADSLEARFLCPVYLVGSFVHKFREAGDIDIVMVMTEKRVIRCFGGLEFNNRRFKFNRKQKLYLEQYVYDFDIDFKVQLVEEFEAVLGEKMRLGKYALEPE